MDETVKRERLMRVVLGRKWSKTTVTRIMKTKTKKGVWHVEKLKATEIVDAILDEVLEILKEEQRDREQVRAERGL